MDFVRAEDEVVSLAEVREPMELGTTPDAGEGIVGIAEIKQFRLRGDGAFERVPIDFPPVTGGIDRPRDSNGVTTAVFRCAHERRINRGKRKHVLTTVRKGL